MQFRAVGLIVKVREGAIDKTPFKIFTQLCEIPDAKPVVHEYYLQSDKGKDDPVSELITELQGLLMQDAVCTGIMNQQNGGSVYKVSLRKVDKAKPVTTRQQAA